MIPKVKTWIVTMADGAQYEVLAPTRRLAVMNFRSEGHWGDIAKIGLQRKPRVSDAFATYEMVRVRS